LGEQQWCLRVSRDGAEEIRRMLLSKGLLDRTLRIRTDGDDLLFPVLCEGDGAFLAEFEVLHQRVDLPRHELVGGIAILHEDDPAGAATILNERPSVHTVLFAESQVEGEFRTKRFKILAGEESTVTIHTEYGHTFRIDLEKAYFSARLASERQRIVGLMHDGEEVLDMFAGVGPFSIMLAENASVIWACDLNPDAISLLIRNIVTNRILNIVPILADAGMLPDIFGKRFDRVIMNLPLMTDRFLSTAFSLCRPGGVIHCYALVSDEDEEYLLLKDFPVKSVQCRFVRSYAPGRSHKVYDITIL
jgi:tRNA (guanine37-N1)-methyltransferase